MRLERVEAETPRGPVLHVRGADLVDGTPIFDIKPYLPYADSHPDARGGFTDPIARKLLRVSAPEELREKFPAGLLGVLENDPTTFLATVKFRALRSADANIKIVRIEYKFLRFRFEHISPIIF